jgi:hypothetical protein
VASPAAYPAVLQPTVGWTANSAGALLRVA